MQIDSMTDVENIEGVENMQMNSNYYDENNNAKEIILAFSSEQMKKIEASMYFNNYDSIEDFISNLVMDGIELDRQRYLKSKQSSKSK